MSLRPEAPSWNNNNNNQDASSSKASTPSKATLGPDNNNNNNNNNSVAASSNNSNSGNNNNAPPPLPTTEAKLFVGQIPYECDESRLRELFEAYGRVRQIHILNDAVNSRGVDPRKARSDQMGKGRAAFVTFETTQEADCAIFTLHNRYRMLTNRPLQVSYAKNSPNISLFGKQAAIEVAKANRSNPMPEMI